MISITLPKYKWSKDTKGHKESQKQHKRTLWPSFGVFGTWQNTCNFSPLLLLWGWDVKPRQKFNMYFVWQLEKLSQCMNTPGETPTSVYPSHTHTQHLGLVWCSGTSTVAFTLLLIVVVLVPVHYKSSQSLREKLDGFMMNGNKNKTLAISFQGANLDQSGPSDSQLVAHHTSTRIIDCKETQSQTPQQHTACTQIYNAK